MFGVFIRETGQQAGFVGGVRILPIAADCATIGQRDITGACRRWEHTLRRSRCYCIHRAIRIIQQFIAVARVAVIGDGSGIKPEGFGVRQITDTSGGNFRRVCGGMESGVALHDPHFHVIIRNEGACRCRVRIAVAAIQHFKLHSTGQIGQLNIRGLRLTRCSEINRIAIKRGNSRHFSCGGRGRAGQIQPPPIIIIRRAIVVNHRFRRRRCHNRQDWRAGIHHVQFELIPASLRDH